MTLFQFSINSFGLVNYIIAYLSLAVVLLFLAIFVWMKSAQDVINRTFSAYSFAIAWWSFFTIPLLTSRYAEAARIWDQVCLSGAIFIPATFFHFVVQFLRSYERYKKIVQLCYFVSAVFFFANLTNYFVADVRPFHFFNFYTVPGTLYTIFVFYFGVISTLGIVLLFLEMHKSDVTDQRYKNQVRWLFITSFLGYMGGGTNYLMSYGVVIPFVTPVANYAILVYGLAVAYIIMRYRFLNIDVFIKKTLVFAGLLAFVFGVFTIATFVMRETLSKYVAGGNSNLWTYAISIFLIVLGYDPIRNLMMELTDRYLFQKKYDYQKLLKDASKGISNIESLERLFGLVVHFITMRMRVSRAAILTKDRGGTRYDLEYQRGYEKNYLAYCIEEANPLIQYLVQEKEAIDIGAVKEYVMQGSKKRGKGGHREYDFN
ncbi:MAG: histidine kinase N-terminal 7TM domain-containing protein, partial [Candidatus Omnitrophica bacterium]|nr:histidine kinase N-terminal 7TM domain-containing protein [Candidatus Omnitrophota bacterium]